MGRTLNASLVSRSSLLICIRCIVNLPSLAPRFAAIGLSSSPIAEPPPGAVPAVERVHTQLQAHLACGGITTVRAQLDQYPSARGNGSVGRAKAVGCDVVLWPDALKGLEHGGRIYGASGIDRRDEPPAFAFFIHHAGFM